MILVTGATGFLGSELVKQLLEKGGKLRAIKRSSSNIPEILEGRDIEWFDADILDYFALREAFAGVSHVYHCAAVVSFQPSQAKQMLKINVEGTAHIVDLCLEMGVEKLIHVSSVAALGESRGGTPVNERCFWEFDGSQKAYAVSKYRSEMEVWRGIAEGLCANIVNPSIIIGKAAGTRGSGQIFETVKKGLDYYTDGGCALVDVRDVVKAMILLMEDEVNAERFILSAGSIANKDFFAAIAGAHGRKAPARHASAWMLELAWRAAWLLSKLSGREYAFNKEVARSCRKQMNYTAEKFQKFFPGFSYLPLMSSIRDAAR